MTKEQFIEECVYNGTAPCRHIKEKANDLYKKMAPTLTKEEKEVLDELIKGQPNEDEVCIRFYAPKEWMLNKEFQEFLWSMYKLADKGNDIGHNS